MRSGARGGLAGLLLAANLVASSCAAHIPGQLPPPPSEELRATFGTVGVRTGAEPPAFTFEAPTSGRWEGAGKGAVEGFFWGINLAGELLQGGGSSSGVVAGAVFVVALATIPVTTVIGSVVGAAVAPGAEAVDLATERLEDAARGRSLQDELGRHVTSAIDARTDVAFTLLDGDGPPVDTILDVRVEELHFVGKGIDPPLPLRVRTRTHLYGADGSLLHEFFLDYEGPGRAFTDWAEDRAEPFHRELERAWPLLAAAIVDEVFLVYISPEEE